MGAAGQSTRKMEENNRKEQLMRENGRTEIGQSNWYIEYSEEELNSLTYTR
jgi:hypothetical protein